MSGVLNRNRAGRDRFNLSGRFVPGHCVSFTPEAPEADEIALLACDRIISEPYISYSLSKFFLWTGRFLNGC